MLPVVFDLASIRDMPGPDCFPARELPRCQRVRRDSRVKSRVASRARAGIGAILSVTAEHGRVLACLFPPSGIGFGQGGTSELASSRSHRKAWLLLATFFFSDAPVLAPVACPDCRHAQVG